MQVGIVSKNETHGSDLKNTLNEEYVGKHGVTGVNDLVAGRHIVIVCVVLGTESDRVQSDHTDDESVEARVRRDPDTGPPETALIVEHCEAALAEAEVLAVNVETQVIFDFLERVFVCLVEACPAVLALLFVRVFRVLFPWLRGLLADFVSKDCYTLPLCRILAYLLVMQLEYVILQLDPPLLGFLRELLAVFQHLLQT